MSAPNILILFYTWRRVCNTRSLSTVSRNAPYYIRNNPLPHRTMRHTQKKADWIAERINRRSQSSPHVLFLCAEGYFITFTVFVCPFSYVTFFMKMPFCGADTRRPLRSK